MDDAATTSCFAGCDGRTATGLPPWFNFFRGTEGSALQEYTRLANDRLFNPEASIDRVEQAYEQQLEADRDDAAAQRGLDEVGALAQVEHVSAEVRELAAQFEEREEQLRARFETTAE